MPVRPTEKSNGLAVLFTVLWPGAGHLYLGYTKKGIPHVIANTIGFVLALTVILLPISLVIWAVTLCMTVFGIADDTETVNASIRAGVRFVEP